MMNKGKSASPKTRHIAIRYFFIKDRIDSSEVVVSYMPTKLMIADIMTKPLQGDLFRQMRSALLGHSTTASSEGELESYDKGAEDAGVENEGAEANEAKG